MSIHIKQGLFAISLLIMLMVPMTACSSTPEATVETREDITDIVEENESSEPVVEKSAADIKADEEASEPSKPVIEESAVNEELRTITGADGVEITLDKPVERIIFIGTEAQLGIVRVLQAENMVVGVLEEVKDLTMIFPAMSQLPVIGTWDGLDYEAILELEPDLVVAPYYISLEELKEKLEPEITVIRLDIGAPLTYAEDVKTVGTILDKEKEAEEYLNWYYSFLNAITEKTHGLSEKERVRVFGFYGGDGGMEEGPPYGTYGQDNFWVNPSIEMAGGVSIAGNQPGDWITVDPEWVITQNIDAIVREVYLSVSGPIMGYDVDDSTGAATLRDSIMSQPEFEASDAVQQDNIYLILGNLQQENWYIGVAYMAKWFHPELFADLDPQAIHQEYLTRFMRVDYDLDKHGIFIYPKP